MHVAGVGVPDAVLRAIARARGSVAGGVGWHVEHLPVGMEGREVQRHVGTEAASTTQRVSCVDLAVGVVAPGDQQRRDLDPHLGLADEVLERVQHRREVAAADAVVELLGERLEVDVGGVHVRDRARGAGRRQT